MIDLVRFSSEALERFAQRFSVTPLIFEGLRCGSITLLDGTTLTNKQLPSAIAKQTPDLIFGCEWVGERDHMDYPQHALRIQTARAMYDASAIYVMTPRVLERFDVARFNARVLRKAKVPIVFSSLAEREEELANPKDLEAIGRLLGSSDQEIRSARDLLEKLPTTRFDQRFMLESPR
jgi:hypothetical protein